MLIKDNPKIDQKALPSNLHETSGKDMVRLMQTGDLKEAPVTEKQQTVNDFMLVKRAKLA